MLKLARVQWEKRNGSPSFWVTDLPGHIGNTPDPYHPRSGWGYGDNRAAALPLTPEQQERLTADRLYCGQLPPKFYDAE